MTTDVRSIPPRTDARWARLVRGETTHRSGVLALNIVLRNATLAVKRDPSIATVEKHVAELHTFFERNAAVLSADIAALFG